MKNACSILLLISVVGITGCSETRLEIDDAITDSSRAKQDTDDTITNSIGMKLVYIPADEFLMGSNDGHSDEEPVHMVKISKGFYMGIYEVTQAQWEAVMGNNPSRFKGDNLPVETVSWDDAMEFCKKLSQEEDLAYTLPTEAQWEYACHAGTTAAYCFGNNESSLDDHAWYRSNSGGKTHPVGQKRPNDFGLYDMHGNVWEWCRDWYNDSYYSKSGTTDPENTETASYRVLRGGCWIGNAFGCRSANRHKGNPGGRNNISGFRVILVP